MWMTKSTFDRGKPSTAHAEFCLLSPAVAKRSTLESSARSPKMSDLRLNCACLADTHGSIESLVFYFRLFLLFLKPIKTEPATMEFLRNPCLSTLRSADEDSRNQIENTFWIEDHSQISHKLGEMSVLSLFSDAHCLSGHFFCLFILATFCVSLR